MDGLLIVDKPSGPTSHDVVARIRRVLRERRIGHTGTLDPMATGVLPLVVGRATRLARFLSASEKTYEAVVRLGFSTDTGDREGTPVGPRWTGALPTKDAIGRALDGFRGKFLQHPPAYSAKKIAGRRSHALARAGQMKVRPWSDEGQTLVRPVAVTVNRLDLIAVEGDLVSLTLDCAAGFYVRALARDLGERLGTGGHLAALRRTRAGELTLGTAIPLAEAERDPAAAAARVIPLSGMLLHFPAMTLSSDEVRRTTQGRDVPSSGFGIRDPGFAGGFVRLLDAAGDLVAIAEPAAAGSGLLHPAVVLR